MRGREREMRKRVRYRIFLRQKEVHKVQSNYRTDSSHFSRSPLRLDRALLVVAHRAQVICLVKAGRLLHANSPDLCTARVLEGTSLGYGQVVGIDLEHQVSVGVIYFTRIAYVYLFDYWSNVGYEG